MTNSFSGSISFAAAILLTTGTLASTSSEAPDRVMLAKETTDAVPTVNIHEPVETNVKTQTSITINGKEVSEEDADTVREAAEAMLAASKELEAAIQNWPLASSNWISYPIGSSADGGSEIQNIVEDAIESALRSLHGVRSTSADGQSARLSVVIAESTDESNKNGVANEIAKELDSAAQRYVVAMSELSNAPGWNAGGSGNTVLVPRRVEPSDAGTSFARLVVASDEFVRVGGAFLGITMANSSERGVEVAAVLPKTGAEDAGIQVGDRIWAVGPVKLGTSSDPQQDLMNYLQKRKPGDSVKLELERDGETIDVTVVTRARPNPEELEKKVGTIWQDAAKVVFSSGRSPFGPSNVLIHPAAPVSVELATLNSSLGRYFGTDSGVLVLHANGFGDLKGGDVVIEIDGKSVIQADRAYQLMRFGTGSDALVTVLRDKKRVDLIIRRDQ